MNTFTTPQHVAELLADGIQANLELMIRDKLHQQADAIISEIARELAAQCVVRLDSYVQHSDPFPSTQLVLKFNNEKVKYVESAA
jgi:hypothetical protein